MSNNVTERLTVLVVDDDAEIRDIIKNYLMSFGFRLIIEAKDGTEAYRIILSGNPKVDLIISDWDMPRTDGLALLKAVRGHNSRSGTPFIMVTSQQQSQEREKIMQAKKYGVTSYIVKPFEPETLHEKVKLALQLS